MREVVRDCGMQDTVVEGSGSRIRSERDGRELRLKNYFDEELMENDLQYSGMVLGGRHVNLGMHRI